MHAANKMSVQCRCCLSTNAVEFIDMSSINVDQLDFYHCYNVCTKLEARVDDDLPGVLCNSCCYDLQVAYNFVQAALKSDAVLREKLRKEFIASIVVELDELKPEVDQAEYVEDSEDVDYVVEEFLEDEDERVTTQMEIMEMDAVEEETLCEEVYLDEKATSEESQTAATAPVQNQDVASQQEQMSSTAYCAEDEADDEYLIEYNEEETATEGIGTPKGAKWKCIQCKRVLRGDVPYEGHMNMHRQLRPYKCTQCACAFRCKNALMRHISRRHNNAKPPEEKQFSCELCHLEFALESELEHHQRAQHISQGRCEKCPKILDSLAALAEHDELVHGTTSVIQCHLCPHTLSLPHVKIAQHYRNAHPAEYRKYFPTVGRPIVEPAKVTPWQCDICKRYMRSETALRDHRNTHLNERPHSCQCCSKRFATGNNLRQHMRSVHPEEYEKLISEGGDTVVQCEVCKKQLLRRNLEKHMALHEKKEREASEAQAKFLCAYCSQEFSKAKYLALHEQNVHQLHRDEPQFQCTICHKKCYQQRYLRAHIKRVHHTVRRPACNVCGNTFKTASQLWAHKLLHEEKRYECTRCGKRYTRQADLRIHMRIHTGEQPFVCQLCDKRFPVRGQLTYHLQRHKGVTHTCPHCGVNYDNRSTLKEHLFKHTGMPYRCELCPGVGFTRRLRFANHMQRTHNQTLSEDELAAVFAKNTGKSVRFKVISSSATDGYESQDSQEVDGVEALIIE